MTLRQREVQRVMLRKNGVEKQVRPVELPTHTFDFQNDWSLNWTAQSIYWTPTLVTWEWWTIGSSSSDSYQSAIMPPSSVYDGKTLKKFKLYIYKWVNAYISWNKAVTVWCGMCASNLNPSCVWEHSYYTNANQSVANVYNWSDHITVTSTVRGEITLEYILNDDGSLVLKVNSTEYNLWQYASAFRTQWTNQNLWINTGRWNVADGNIYIRKVEIYTE